MASIKILDGTYGFSTIIYDTSLYNWIRQYSSPVNLVVNGTITEYGSALKTIISSYANQIRLSGGHNLTAGEYDFADVTAWMKVIFPNFYVWDTFVREDIDAKYNESSEYSYVRLKHDGAYGSIANRISIDGSTYYAVGWGDNFPYASMRGIATDKIRFTIAVFDDDGTNVTALYIDSTRTGITGRYVDLDSLLTDILKTWIAGIPAWSDTDDPFNPGGNTTPSPKPSTGDFDNTSDPIDIPLIPSLSAVDARFITLYTPSLTELRGLASYMWSDLFSLNTLKKLFADPMQAILGISIVPFIPDKEVNQSTVYVGNIATTITMTKVTNQYKTIDCGTLNLHEYWGSYLDYDPYTKLEIYLPYIGTQTIAVDDVMSKAIHVVYNIDVLSGACVAFLKSDDSVLYTFTGQCATQIPITSNDWVSTINGVLSFTASAIKTGVAIASGEAVSSVTGAISTASNVSQMKPRIQRSGSIGGAAGLMSIQKPYFILTRPRQALPTDQNKYTGYPSFITSTLGDLTGMTYVYEIHLEGIPCTTEEQNEIENLLKSGVIL